MKSLTARLTFWYALIVTLTVAVLLIVGRFYLERNLIKGVDLLNQVEFEEIQSRIKSPAGMDSQQELIASIREHAELDAALYFFQVANADQEILYKSSNLGAHLLPPEVHGKTQVTVKDDELGWIRSMEFEHAGLDIHIVSSLNSTMVLFNNYEQIGLIACWIVFLLSLVVGCCFSRLAIRPIASIQSTAQRITASSFNERIPVPNTGDEIAKMALLLNEMLDRLENSYQQVKRFTAEASHEFRTPLSIIRLHTEHLLSHPELSPHELEAALSEQMEEVERLNSMIDDLLLLAKADSGVMALDLRSVDLAEYFDDLATDLDLLTADKGVRFELQQLGPASWVFDPSWMRQVILNLVSNALAVSASEALIELRVELAGNQLRLSVRDEGPGVAAEDLMRMFDRFERLGQKSYADGNGLGLAICSSIVKRHAGTIQAKNRIDRSGLCVEVYCPQCMVGELQG